MYSIKAVNRTGEEYYIYRDDLQDETLKLNSPKLDLTENSAGQLSFKMPPNNAGYDKIDRITTEFVVNRSGTEIWRGRIISIKEDFFKNKTVTCEGELAFLNDTTQPQELYEGISLESLLNTFLTNHNSKVDAKKRFYVGEFNYDTSKNTNEYEEVYTNYDTTFKAITEKILSVSAGYIYLTKNASGRYINHRAYVNRPYGNQVINFGKNLLDFTKNYDATQFATVVLPLGARLENRYGINMSGIDGVQAYTTVEDVNGGSPYVVNNTAVNNFGWIETVVNFDDIDDEEELLEAAKEYLNDIQYDTMTLEVSAVDLNYLNVDTEQLKLSDRVRVISKPHGLDRYFPITKISIPLDNPANTTFTMGEEGVPSLSTRTVRTSVNLENEIRIIPTQEEILNNAKTNSSNLISSFTTGYITITQRDNNSNELYITETPIPKDFNADNPAVNIDKYWRWNSKGLGYYNKNKTDLPQFAITMEGEIDANYITTGKLDAGVITAGILKNNQWDSGKNVFYLDLENGILKMNADTLSIGGSSAATQAFANSAASSAATNAINNLSGTSIYQKLANAGQGIYASGGNFYINAGYIMAGTLSLGGYNNQKGQLNIYDANGTLTHEMNNGGFISHGYNFNKSYYYDVKYGKIGSLNEQYKSNDGRIIYASNIYSNFIGYYLTSDINPFAYIGIRGSSSNTTKYQQLDIYNMESGIDILSKNSLYLRSYNNIVIDPNTNGKLNDLSSIILGNFDSPEASDPKNNGSNYNHCIIKANGWFEGAIALCNNISIIGEQNSGKKAKQFNSNKIKVRHYYEDSQWQYVELDFWNGLCYSTFV